MDKRFIEESFPVKEVSIEAAKEKNIRHGHISTLHIWWARKPLSASRSTSYSSLISKPIDEIDWIKKRNFIINFSKWDNSLNQNMIEIAKKDILANNDGVPPKVLDPFAGGGSIPLETLRLGCETYANDYNPVAVFLEKCTLEYPQKYGKKLIKDVEKWGKWILNEAKNEIGTFYRNINKANGYFGDVSNEEIPIGYYWMWSVKCQNPNCNAEIPLNTNWWLARKGNKRIAIYPNINDHNIDYQLVGTGHADFPDNYDPSKGTIKRAIATCLVCGTVMEPKILRKQFKGGKAKEKLMAIVSYKKGKKGKKYSLSTDENINEYKKSEKYLEKKIDSLRDKGIDDPIPNEEIPLMSGTFNVPIYGFTKWGDLFNSRQKLSLLTFTEKIVIMQEKLEDEGYDEDYIKAISSYLAIVLNRLADKNARLVVYDSGWEKIAHVFGRPALPMIWDYIELNVFSEVNGDWISNMKWVTKVLEHLTEIKGIPATITQSSAKELPYSNDYFDAIFTDPPYYNSIPYADLSDFFYVWLKRTIGNLYPDLFATPLSPKTNELAEMASWDKKRYSHKTKEYFEENLKEILSEMSRVLKPNGIATIVYAHKTTDGWETVINAIMDSGLLVKASWPISTEMKVRLRSMGSATLASSIYIVARKEEKSEIGWLKDVKEEIAEYVPKKLDKLWSEGISGADFFIAAIGSAIEVFGKYERVLDNQGNEVRANKMLSYVRDVVTDYTVKQIVHNGITDSLSPLTKFYLLWRWNYIEAKVPFDEARKLAQSAGIDLTNEWNNGFIIKRGEYITVQGPDKRDKKSLQNSKELIDVLHLVCIYWKEGNTSEMKLLLNESNYGNNEAFYKVSQAISETLPNSSTEKKLIEGFLAGKERIMKDMGEKLSQTKLV